MTITFHSRVEELVQQLTNFHACVNPSHLLTNLVQEAAKEREFRDWQKEQKPAGEAAGSPPESASPRAKGRAKPNGVHPSVLAAAPGKTEEVRS